MSNKKRRYSQEFIKESVDYALTSPSVKSAAENLGVPEATLHGWVSKAKQSGEAISSSGEAVDIGKMLSELRELRKQVSRLEQEKAILKKAAVNSTGHCNT